jgi:hypothetical protein
MADNVLAFPPRDAGRVLEEAMQAADSAARQWAHSHADLIRDPWAQPWEWQEQARAAAATAAAAALRSLTADGRMVSIVAYGMAEEAMIRLRKRGVVA